jgi:ubiquinone/menaquinone biosynthesis C-methylase UbiE
LRFATGDASALSFGDASFDTVISCECIEHVLDPAVMAREIYRVLRPRGKFYLTTENYFNGMILMWLKAWITGVPIDTGSGTQPHENFFLFWRVRRMLERSGLRVTHMESDHFQWLMLPRVSPSTLCTTDFQNRSLKRVFRPFGRHFLYAGFRPG